MELKLKKFFVMYVSTHDLLIVLNGIEMKNLEQWNRQNAYF